ncbi:hypothetical protein M011DRAFT_468077 [Sporormia fimetaria CBS 119925]|uniref:Uncharacterized protein n=1 Tax=Sporormia fimetaria CBS 119925 TaxID=1340428 RepID=A0A6A6VBU8_9PLEO|nr:hypothetical protein M011DRAFT_468077 [Sporormia fimetaria CBS 119925]
MFLNHKSSEFQQRCVRFGWLGGNCAGCTVVDVSFAEGAYRLREDASAIGDRSAGMEVNGTRYPVYDRIYLTVSTL